MPNPFETPDNTFVTEKIPVFAPKRMVQIDSSGYWEPLPSDKVFYPDADTTFTLGAEESDSVFANLQQGFVQGIVPGTTFTFSTAPVLVVG